MFKYNRDLGRWVCQQDGTYEVQSTNPVERIRVQLRKGHVVNESDARVLKRVGPWPGEPDEAAIEDLVTSG